MTKATCPSAFDYEKLVDLAWTLVGMTPDISIGGYHIHLHGLPICQVAVSDRYRPTVDEVYEGHLILSGTARVLAGAQPMPVGPGSLIFSEPSRHYVLEAGETPLLTACFWLDITPGLTIPVPAAWPQAPEALWDMMFLQEDAQRALIGWPERAVARLTAICSHLLALSANPHATMPESAPLLAAVARIEGFLRWHFTEPVTLHDVAAHVGMNLRTMQRVYQRIRGCTVMEYLLRVRMQHATALLADSNCPIAVVAQQVGYADPGYFSRRFLSYAGLTPHAYRRERQNQTLEWYRRQRFATGDGESV